MAANHTINEPSSTPRARTRLIGLGAVLLLAASCSGGSDASTTPTVLLTSTAPTTVATTTTTEATTTTEDPAIAHERDVAEITEVYEKSVTYLVTFGLTVDRKYLETYVGDPLLSIKIKNTEAWAEQGHQIGTADYDVKILSVEIEGHLATSLSCNFDQIELLTSSGQVVIPPDSERYLRETHFERFASGWKVVDTGYAHGEATPCAA